MENRIILPQRKQASQSKIITIKGMVRQIETTLLFYFNSDKLLWKFKEVLSKFLIQLSDD